MTTPIPGTPIPFRDFTPTVGATVLYNRIKSPGEIAPRTIVPGLPAVITAVHEGDRLDLRMGAHTNGGIVDLYLLSVPKHPNDGDDRPHTWEPTRS